jgi:hypothetical protein
VREHDGVRNDKLLLKTARAAFASLAEVMLRALDCEPARGELFSGGDTT